MMADLLPVTLPEMIAECERELKVRAAVYPHLVHTGVVAQDEVDRRIAVMEEIARYLRREGADNSGA